MNKQESILPGAKDRFGDSRYLITTFDWMRALLQEKLKERTERPERAELPELPERPEPPASALAIASLFELDDFSLDTLLMASFLALEPDATALVTSLQGQIYPVLTVGTALSILPNADWTAFSVNSPLRRYHLIELEGDVLSSRTISIPESLLMALVVGPTMSEAALELVRQPQRPAMADDWPHNELDALLGSPQVMVRIGGSRAAGETIAQSAAARAGLQVFHLDVEGLPQQPGEIIRSAAVLARDMLLTGGLLVAGPASAADPGRRDAFLARYSGRVVILDDEDRLSDVRDVIVLEDAYMPSAVRQGWWSAEHEDPADDRFSRRIAYQFHLSRSQMAALSDRHANRLQRQERDTAEAQTWGDARRMTRASLSVLAERIEPTASSKDLIVPARTASILSAIEGQVRCRPILESEWGFKETGTGRGHGLAALFSGPSGVGKTLAAEVLAVNLGLDLYRIDLAAVMSKWIGETEKHLARLFDVAERSGAILLFDECDALFGKRSDAHEDYQRYANVTVAYLLQRLERYSGLTILTTNLKSNVDEAFLRRLRFVVDFPFPEADERRAIWQTAFPADCPLDEIDFDRLAQLSVTGGAIRNISINAANLAAARAGNSSVTMQDIRSAAELEREKTGRGLSASEVAGWVRHEKSRRA